MTIVAIVLGKTFRPADGDLGVIQRFLLVAGGTFSLFETSNRSNEAISLIALVIGLKIMLGGALLGIRLVVMTGGVIFAIFLVKLVFGTVDRFSTPFFLLILGIISVLIGLGVTRFGYLKKYIFNQIDSQRFGLINDEKLKEFYQPVSTDAKETEQAGGRKISIVTLILLAFLLFFVLPPVMCFFICSLTALLIRIIDLSLMTR